MYAELIDVNDRLLLCASVDGLPHFIAMIMFLFLGNTNKP